MTLPAKLTQDFKFHMSVDWLSVRVQLNDTSRGDALQKIFKDHGVSWVEPHDRGAGKAATDFSFRLQNPASFADVHGLIDKLKAGWGIVAPPQIDGIEISFDAIPKHIDAQALDSMTRRFMREAMPPLIHSSGRLAGPDGLTHFLFSARGPQLSADATMYIGDWSKTNSLPADGIAFRAYKKIKVDQ
jgi:hypothetical protein